MRKRDICRPDCVLLRIHDARLQIQTFEFLHLLSIPEYAVSRLELAGTRS